MKYQIKYKELKEYLETLKESDFDRYQNVGVIKEGFAMDDIEFFKQDKSAIPAEQIIDYGMPFLVDILGNDLSVVILTRRKYKMPNGRVVGVKFDKTIIDDCRKLYGTPLNGYWIIPDKYIIKLIDSGHK